MNKIFILFLIALFYYSPAQAQGGQAYSSGVPTSAAFVPQTAPPPLPSPMTQQGYNQALQQVQQGQQQAAPQACQPCPQLQPQLQQQGQNLTQPSTAPADPCAAYQTQDGYAVCQDRLKKLSRVQSYRDNQTKSWQDRAQAKLDAEAVAAQKKSGQQAAPVPTEQAIGAPKNFAPIAEPTAKK